MWTISNFISFLRLLMSVPAGYCLWHGEKTALLIIMLLAFISDFVDGGLARKLNQVSEAGKIIDPLADKVFVTTIIVISLFQGSMPLWVGIIIIARDIIILLSGVYFARKLKYVIPSNYTGKITVDIIGIYLLLIIFGQADFASYWLWLVLLGVFVSLLHYAIRAFRLLKQKTE